MAQSTARRREPGPKSFFQHFFERRDIHYLFCQEFLQFGVLDFQRLQLLGVRHFHTAIL